ncbi:MAG: LEA type 2 family protein [Bacteroidota bacterium]
MPRSNNSAPLILGGTLAVIWYFTRTASAALGLEYGVKSFTISKLSTTSISTVLDFEVRNPSGVQLNMDEFLGTIEQGGRRLTNIRIREQKIIQAKSRKRFVIPFELDLNNLLLIANDFLETRRLDDVHLVGSILLNGVRYPIDETFPLTV